MKDRGRAFSRHHRSDKRSLERDWGINERRRSSGRHARRRIPFRSRSCSRQVAAVLAQSYPTRPPASSSIHPGRRRHTTAMLHRSLSELLPTSDRRERPGRAPHANEYSPSPRPRCYTLLFNSPAVVINMSSTDPPYDVLRISPACRILGDTNSWCAGIAFREIAQGAGRARAERPESSTIPRGPGSTQHSQRSFPAAHRNEHRAVRTRAARPRSPRCRREVQLSFINPVAVGRT